MPFQLFVYNDLPYLSPAGGARTSRQRERLLGELVAELSAEPNVVIVEVAEQVEKLGRLPEHYPFAATIGIGASGAAIARLLHQHTARFPVVHTVPLTRVEVAVGRYELSRSSVAFLEHDLSGLLAAPLAIVDDTIYSGLTLQRLIERLPAPARGTCEVFCLQAIGESLPPLRRLCPVHAGIEIAGRIEEEVSIVKASHLFQAGAIRFADRRGIAFYERPEWMRRWFPGHVERITAVCAALNALERQRAE